MKIVLNINDKDYGVDVEPYTSLNEVLRDKLGLTGTKRGCDTGGCGICTVMLNDRAVYSCMTPAWKAENKKVSTIEGLEKNGKLTPIQDAFVRHMAPQCGYCTSGIVMAMTSMLKRTPNPSEREMLDALSGVLCRCTGYIPYIEAMRELIKGK